MFCTQEHTLSAEKLKVAQKHAYFYYKHSQFSVPVHVATQNALNYPN